MAVKQQYKLRYVFPTGGIPAGTVFEGDLDTYQGFIKAGIVQVIEKVVSGGKSKVQPSRNEKDRVQPTLGDKSIKASDEGRNESLESSRRYGGFTEVNDSANPAEHGDD